MAWLEDKYVGLISSRLEKFKKRGNTYNFRCPVCGDSHKDKNKTRGYIFDKKGSTIFHCHNCGSSMSIANFLKYIDPVLHKEYTQERFIQTHGFNTKPIEKKPDITSFARPKFQTVGVLKHLKRISQLDPTHPAKLYVSRREIPSTQQYKLFYAPKFKKFVNGIIPNKFNEESLTRDEPRLIIPFIDRDGNVFGFQGRSFQKDAKLRYITIMLDESRPKMFGLDAVDFTKTVYIFEGPIDSMFIPNSLAMAGADMIQAQAMLKLDPKKCVVVMDNEPRNGDIVKRIESCLNMGYGVCLWPHGIEQKDVNDMVLAGMSPIDIKMVIDVNTYRGLEAKLALSTWKRV